jgi:hypothetical protein
MRTVSLVLGVVVLVLIAGCESFTGPEAQVIAIIERVTATAVAPSMSSVGRDSLSHTGVNGPALELPDTVEAGEEFAIVIRSWGPDGCWSAAGTDVSQEQLTVSLIAYDKKTGDGYCTMEPVRLSRTIKAKFSQAGSGVVTLTGRRIYETGEMPETVSVQRTVVIK